MAVRKQLSVMMENVPGTLAILCRNFGAKHVNILAFTSGEHEGKGLVRLVADKVAAARKALQEVGYAYVEEQVLSARLPNRPGTLAALAKQLGDAGINIDYAYSGVEPRSARQLIVVSVPATDFARAKKLVR